MTTTDTGKILAAMRGPLMGMPASVGAIARHADVEDTLAQELAVRTDARHGTGRLGRHRL